MAKKYLNIDLYNGTVSTITAAQFKANAQTAQEMDIEPETGTDGHVSYIFEEWMVVAVDIS